MPPRTRKRKGTPGDVVRIDIGDGRQTYGVLLTSPYVAVYDHPTPAGRDADPAELVGRPVLFIIAVNDRVVAQDWPVVGRVPPELPLPPVPEFFLQDMFDPASCQIIDVDGNARPATPQECVGLERAAVWDTAHVTGRIADHYAGRPNPHLAYMKLKVG